MAYIRSQISNRETPPPKQKRPNSGLKYPDHLQIQDTLCVDPTWSRGVFFRVTVTSLVKLCSQGLSTSRLQYVQCIAGETCGQPRILAVAVS
jgi:hypothetical protein